MAATSFSKNVASQQFSSQEEDKVIENGIKALQQRLQAPLEISAAAKSNAECGERLCKEKVKTQQAKAREIISNRGEILRLILDISVNVAAASSYLGKVYKTVRD